MTPSPTSGPAQAPIYRNVSSSDVWLFPVSADGVEEVVRQLERAGKLENDPVKRGEGCECFNPDGE